MICLLNPSDTPKAIQNSKEISAKEISQRVNAWKKQIVSSKAKRVLLFSEDTLDALCVTLASWNLGIEVILLPEASTRFADAAKTDGFIKEGDVAALEAEKSLIAPKLGTPIEPLAKESPIFVDENATLLYLFTSGSTGKAKLIPKKISQFIAESSGALTSLSSFCKKNSLVEVISTVTHQHMFGFSFRLFFALFADGLLITNKRVHLIEDLKAELIAAFTRGHDACLISTPTHLNRLADFNEHLNLPYSLTGVLSATAPLPESGAKACVENFGVFATEILGSTETGAIAVRVQPRETHWRAFNGIELKIQTPSGKSKSGIGTLIVRGDQLFNTEEITSDKVELSINGEFKLIGRTDKIIKIEGKRFSSQRIQDALLKLNADDARVFVLESNSFRNELASVILLSKDESQKLLKLGKAQWVKQAKEKLKQILSPLEIPRKFRFVSKMPTENFGVNKVTNSSLKQLFSDTRPDWIPVEDIVNSDKRTIRVRAKLTNKLPWFNGHFNNLPILPGVSQLLLAERVFKEFVDSNKTPSKVKKLKFKSPITPGMTVELTLSFPISSLENTSEIPLSFIWERICDGQRVIHSSGQIILH